LPTKRAITTMAGVPHNFCSSANPQRILISPIAKSYLAHKHNKKWVF
jgi:hypothetical protein